MNAPPPYCYCTEKQKQYNTRGSDSISINVSNLSAFMYKKWCYSLLSCTLDHVGYCVPVKADTRCPLLAIAKLDLKRPIYSGYGQAVWSFVHIYKHALA